MKQGFLFFFVLFCVYQLKVYGLHYMMFGLVAQKFLNIE